MSATGHAFLGLLNVAQAMGDGADVKTWLEALLESRPGDERLLRAMGQMYWEEAERLRDSSIFRDVEDGTKTVEDRMRDEKLLLGQETDVQTRLQKQAVLWATHIASQSSVLGRLDALLNSDRYQHTQGRLRCIALDQYRRSVRTQDFRLEASADVLDAETRLRFTLGGQVKVAEQFFLSTMPDEYRLVLTDEDIKSFVAFNRSKREGKSKDKIDCFLSGFQPSDHLQFVRAYKRQAPDFGGGDLGELTGKSVAVIGEREPFLVAVAAAVGATVVSVNLSEMENRSALVSAARLDDWLNDGATYDVITCKPLIPA